MTIKNKIRKRIDSWNIILEEPIKYINITKEEAEKLGDNIKQIDGVKLIVADKLTDKIKGDCFAYHKNKCQALNKLYCINSECKFYRNDVTMKQIKDSIKYYSKK